VVFVFVGKFASGARRPEGPEARGWKPVGPKPGGARVWCSTAVPGGASQQVCGFRKFLESSTRLDYSEDVSSFFLDLFADSSAYRAHVTALQAAQACRPA